MCTKAGKFVSPEVLGGLLDNGRFGQDRPRPSRTSLTPRETEIMKLLAEGNTVRKIAGMFGLSLKTVEAHKFNLMRKLDIHNKAELVHCAIRKKIVKMPADFSRKKNQRRFVVSSLPVPRGLRDRELPGSGVPPLVG